MAPAPLEILCIDDDADIRAIVKMSLGLDPLIVTHMADGGEEAVRLLRQGLRPGLLLIDQRLRGMNGTDLIAHMRELGLLLPPIVFLTAAVRDDDINRFDQLGAAGAVAKPFDPLTLATRLRVLLADLI